MRCGSALTSTDMPQPTTTTPTSPDRPDAPTQAPGDHASIELTGARPMPWLRFVLVIAVVLAADLGLKAWSFEHVADTPIKVRTAEGGGPEVLIPDVAAAADVDVDGRGVATSDGSGWRVVSTVGPMGEPPRIPRHDPIVVVPGLLNFQLTLNTGAVFGTGQGGRPIFIAVSVVAVIVIVVLMARSPARATAYHVGLALILGGALGNLYDRLVHSAVRDMLHMLPGTGLWPWIFNPADVALVLGVGMVLLVSYLSERKAAKAEKAKTSAKAS